MDAKIHVVTLGVQDILKSREFYEKGLSFDVAKVSDTEMVLLKLRGTAIMLYSLESLAQDMGLPVTKSAGCQGVALIHNTQTQEEVDKVMAEVEKAGGKIIKPANKTFWGGYAGYFADLDGYIWEVAYGAFWKFDAEGSLIID